MRGEYRGLEGQEPAPRLRPYGGGRFGVDLNTYIVEFAKTVLERIASIPANPYDPEGDRKLPKWRRPDSAFGWAEMPGRPPSDTWWRDMGIAACVELYARKGFPWEQAMLKTATKFELSVATVEKALSKAGSRANRYMFAGESTEDIDEFFREQLAIWREQRARRGG